MAGSRAGSQLSRLKAQLREAAHFQGSPHELALALALGILLGVLPGTGAAVAAALALWFRLNFALMVSGALLVNPITAPFLYVFSYALGARLLGDRLPSGWVARITAGTLVGNLVLASALSLMAYVIMFLFIRAHRARKNHAAGD